MSEPTMKVLVVGMPRTGTTSLRHALKQLGYPKGYHWDSMCHDRHANEWKQLVERKYVHHESLSTADFEPVLNGYTNAADWPPMLFAPELIKAYPDAKIILSVRNNARVWQKSMEDTIWEFQRRKREPRGLWETMWWYTLPTPTAYAVHDLYSILWKTTPFGRFETEGEEWYLDHNEAIRKLVPAERLLEFNVKEGWGPLCAFLGQEVPMEPFPRVNETESFRRDAEGHWTLYKKKKVDTWLSSFSRYMLGFGGLLVILHLLTM